jgi:N-acetylglucosaminyldiphosphoundecaprenol N-acetyl-beta-D-mannosaminyltransferase
MYLTELKDKLVDHPIPVKTDEKLLISTMNAYSFCILQKDKLFQDAIINSHRVLSDGVSIVWALRVLTGMKIKKFAGADLFAWEMDRLQKIKGKCFFLGSSDSTLRKICERIKFRYPDVRTKCYSPPFKDRFNEEDNEAMISAINSFSPDVLFIGMTAPKQEKWGAGNFNRIKASRICCIGAVFDFFALTKKRAPKWMIDAGLEWFYRLILEPKRNWKRYLFGNSQFLGLILKEKLRMIIAANQN